MRCACRRRCGARAERRSRGAEGKIPPARRDPVSRHPIRIRRRSARSARRCFTTSACPRTARIACATCHDPSRKDFPTAARPRSACLAVRSRAIRRRCGISPGRGPVFWDGRARSLEEQVAGPIVAPDEMAQPMDKLIARLAADKTYARAFAQGVSGKPARQRRQPKKAIATYERTLVSPQTRFDRWIAGDARAVARRRSTASACSPAKRAARTAIPAGRSPTTRSTISGCRARIAGAARCCGWRRPSTHSRRRRCAKSAAARRTCTTDRSRRLRRGAPLRRRHHRAADLGARSARGLTLDAASRPHWLRSSAR